jgi:multidrug resistance efflux pump
MDKNKLRKIMIPGIIIVLGVFLYTSLAGAEDSKYYGEIEPDAYDVYATVPGVIDELLVSEGEKIKADQVVMRLDALEAALLQEKAELASRIAKESVGKSVSPVRDEELNIQNNSISQLTSQRAAMDNTISGARTLYEQSLSRSQALKAAYELQQNNYNNVRALYDTGAVSKQDLDNANLALINSQSAYDSAQLQSTKAQNDINVLYDQRKGVDAQIDAASEQLVVMSGGYDEPDQRITALNSDMVMLDAELAKINADKYDIKALNGGVVESINYAMGEYVNKGAPVMSLYDPSRMLVSIYIHEKDLLHVTLGMDLEFTLESDNRIELSGTVKSIATESMFTPVNIVMSEDRERLVYQVEVELQMTNQVKPGMLVSTDIEKLE